MIHLYRVWIGHPFNVKPEYVWANTNDQGPITQKIEQMASRLGPDEAAGRLCSQWEHVPLQDGDAMIRLWQKSSPFEKFWKRLESELIKHNIPVNISVTNDRMEFEMEVHPSKAQRVSHSFASDKEYQRGFKTIFNGVPESVDLELTSPEGVKVRLAPQESELNAMIVYRVMNA